MLQLRPHEVQRAALAGAADAGRGALRMNAAHARRAVGKQRLHLGSDLHRPRHRRPGDDQARARNGETAVHRQPEVAGCRPHRAVRAGLGEVGLERSDPGSGSR